ncbi:GNAT family N-acetyltransferase [Phenylobacterium sp.]|uniref:GNAT family N-acetyltransferase n=1 Tax=Phenylobacterium sp. TaxID=1871053 RepID=UPI002C5D2C5F|nr:GNAT family N-acetyltransferase [Phenylobacterium sp.]HVI31366.1 GNAT family N-acetyltransferase [Phenylobacterium sp.]
MSAANSAPILRTATGADAAALRGLMDRSIRRLLEPFLSPEAVEASFEVMGLDTQLLADATYYVVELDGRLAASGGWSRRATLFGGDHTSGRSAALLDPALEPARVRAMYTDPDFARRGLGRMILDACEAAARAEGFRAAELAATLGGLPLYRACGYREVEPFEVETSSGVRVPLVRMAKDL